MKQAIGSTHIRTVQSLNLIVLIGWISISIPFYFINHNINSIYVSLVGTLFLGTINFLYLRVFEVTTSNGFIQVRSILRRRRFEKSCFNKIEKTFFSPMLYRLVLDNREAYYFAIDNDLALRVFLGQKNEQEMVKILEKPILS